MKLAPVASLLLAGGALLSAPGPQEPGLPFDDAARLPLVRIDLELVAGGDGAAMEVLTAPVLTTVEGQAANIQVTRQKSYVAGYQARAVDGGREVLTDPVVATFESGVTMTVRAHRDRQGRWGGALSVTETVLDEIRDFEALLGDTEVVVQVPVGESRTRHLFLAPRADGVWFLDLGADPTGHRRVLRVRMSPLPEHPAIR